MLFVHCGLHRTATTSFQAALARHADQLAADGIVYPERWREGGRDAHHGLTELLRPGPAGEARFGELAEYVAAQEGRTVLISSEWLTNWLASVRRSSLLGLLRAAQGAAPVTCIWTLRSFDQVFTSHHLRQLTFGAPRTSAEDYLRWLDDRIAGLRELEDELGEESIYVKYDDDGAHCAEILERCGASAALRGQIAAELLAGPRVNARLSRKQAVALLHTEAISVRAGAPIARDDLVALFFAGELSFEDDEPCEVVEPGVRRALHEEGLRASRAHGFAPYPDFYGELEIGGASPAPLAPDLLSAADLDRLLAALAGTATISLGEAASRR